LLADEASLSHFFTWSVRVGITVAAILISGGFFFSAMRRGATKPNSLISLLYIGVVVLAASLMTLGIGLLNGR
jgi:hypothetical protein